MKLSTKAKVQAYGKIMIDPPGSDALIFISTIASVQAYPNVNSGMYLSMSLGPILPKTAVRVSTAARPHLLALTRVDRVISMLTLYWLKPISVLYHSAYIKMCICQASTTTSNEKVIGVN